MRTWYFRIWHPSKQTFFYCNFPDILHRADYAQINQFPTWDGSGDDLTNELPITEEVFKMQDKPVFVGDIISLDQSDIGGEKIIGEVVYNEDTTLSRYEYGLWIKGKGYMKTDFMGTVEILGNRFENPEMSDLI